MLNLSQVQAFIAVADEGSFQSAAERLDYSQPTISLQVRKLEEFLGVPLIARSKARSVLTRDGELFLPHARALVASADRARDRLKRRRFTVAASSNIGVYLAPRLLASFKRYHADDAEIALKIGTNRETIDALLTGEADVALSEWSEPHAGVHWHSWRREKLVVIVCPDHPLVRERCVSRQTLLNYPMLGGEAGTGTGRIIRDFLGEDAGQLKKGMQLGSTAAVKEAVKANLGISIVLAYSVAEDIAFGSLVGIDLEDADFYKSLQAGLQTEMPETSLARVFHAFLTNQAN